MGLYVKETGRERKIVPEGIHSAICVSLFDLGVQHNPNFDKDQPKILVVWELPHERVEIDRESLPMLICKRYTSSLNSKSNLRKDLEAWRGRPFTAQELLGFDSRELLGKPCQIQVVHAERGDKRYANINAIMAIPKGLPPIVPESELVCYDMDHDDVLPASTPAWIVEVIEQSLEWKNRGAEEEPGKSPHDDPPGGNPPEVESHADDTQDDESLPF